MNKLTKVPYIHKLISMLPFLIVTLSISTLEAATFYIDSSNGSDNKSGTTESTAWKSINKIEANSFSPGDIIAFKRGEIWYDKLTFKSSGTKDSPIIITAYGSGAKPIISAFGKLNGTWINEGNNKWSIPARGTVVSRLFKEGKEQKRTSIRKFGHTDEEFGNPNTNTVWIYENKRVYYYSTSNPQSSSFEGNLISSTIGINGISHITIDDIELFGGPIDIRNSNNITIKNCIIGKKSSYGIEIKASKNLIIENNIFDADFTLKYANVKSYRGTDSRGVSDGIGVYIGLLNSTIRYNTFKNWGHAAIALISHNAIENNIISHNIFTTPDTLYGRGIAMSGNGVQHNNIHHNYFYKQQTRSQLNGKNNLIHHNWFNDMRNTPMKKGEHGQAFALENYNGNPTGNIYEYNTFENVVGPAIELVASGSPSKDISNNIFRKNLFKNCGLSPYYPNAKKTGIYVQDFIDIRANIFTDNAFSGIGKMVYHRKLHISPSEFNNRNGVKGDEISGNTYIVTDQGAGKLNISNLGSNGSNNETIISESNTDNTEEDTTPEVTPFVMTKGVIK